MKTMIRRWLISTTVLAIAAYAAYTYFHGRASDRIKVQMLGVADDMTLEPPERTAMKRLIERVHDEKFAGALDIMRTGEPKFDVELYFRSIFDAIVSGARSKGLNALADKIDLQRASIRLTVTER